MGAGRRIPSGVDFVHFHLMQPNIGQAEAGFRAGITIDPDTIRILGTACMEITGTTGIEYNINGAGWTEISGYTEVSPAVWDITLTAPDTIDPDDTVQVRYVGESGTIVDCGAGEDIGDQLIDVQNTLRPIGGFVLTEDFGIVLLEEDRDTDPAGVFLENHGE